MSQITVTYYMCKIGVRWQKPVHSGELPTHSGVFSSKCYSGTATGFLVDIRPFRHECGCREYSSGTWVFFYYSSTRYFRLQIFRLHFFSFSRWVVGIYGNLGFTISFATCQPWNSSWVFTCIGGCLFTALTLQAPGTPTHHLLFAIGSLY